MIKTAKTMHAVKQHIDSLLEQQLPHELFVAFDIDMTITQPDHPAVYYPNLRAHRALYTQLMSTLSPAERDRKVTLSIQLLPQRLVEPETPRIIKEIQQTGIQTIAFTASLAGPLFFNPTPTQAPQHIEALRFEWLKKFNIDFAQFSTEDFVLDEIPAHNDQCPVFFKGILCANGEQGKDSSKGDVLIAFLKKMDLQPKAIVLIDDRMPNLESVSAALTKYYPQTQFLGLEYQGAFDYAPQAISAQDFQIFWEDLAHKSR
jgi:hypothetical protein